MAALLVAPAHSISLGKMTFEAIEAWLPKAAGDIALVMQESGGEIWGCWQYDSNRFDDETVKRLGDWYVKLLQAMVLDPLQCVGAVKLFSEQELSGMDAFRTPEHETLPHSLESIPTAAIDFDAEAELDATIVPPRDRSFDAAAPKRVLLTGATGFVGAFLVEELLRRTNAEVVCLVRAADEARAGQRLRENMSKYGLNPPGFGVRTVPLPGDFSKPRLGLSPSAFDALAEQIDAIYHNGANVNLSAPYEVLRSDERIWHSGNLAAIVPVASEARPLRVDFHGRRHGGPPRTIGVGE